jgi:hypothetical protein
MGPLCAIARFFAINPANARHHDVIDLVDFYILKSINPFTLPVGAWQVDGHGRL